MFRNIEKDEEEIEAIQKSMEETQERHAVYMRDMKDRVVACWQSGLEMEAISKQ